MHHCIPRDTTWKVEKRQTPQTRIDILQPTHCFAVLSRAMARRVHTHQDSTHQRPVWTGTSVECHPRSNSFVSKSIKTKSTQTTSLATFVTKSIELHKSQGKLIRNERKKFSTTSTTMANSDDESTETEVIELDDEANPPPAVVEPRVVPPTKNVRTLVPVDASSAPLGIVLNPQPHQIQAVTQIANAGATVQIPADAPECVQELIKLTAVQCNIAAQGQGRNRVELWKAVQDMLQIERNHIGGRFDDFDDSDTTDREAQVVLKMLKSFAPNPSHSARVAFMQLMCVFAMMRLGREGFRFVGTEFECAIRAANMVCATLTRQKLVVQPRLCVLVLVKMMSAHMQHNHQTPPIVIVASNASTQVRASSKTGTETVRRTNGIIVSRETRDGVRTALEAIVAACTGLVNNMTPQERPQCLNPPPSARPMEGMSPPARKRKATQVERAGKRPKRLFADLVWVKHRAS